MQTGQTDTGSSGQKGECRTTGSFHRCVHGVAVEVERDNVRHEPLPTMVYINCSSHGLYLNEAELDDVIENLKAAKKAAWPKPLKPLCPASSELLKYLWQHGEITPLKAGEVLGIKHLPRRIKDLKEHGHDIKTTLKTDYANKRYAHYELTSYMAGKTKIVIDGPFRIASSGGMA